MASRHVRPVRLRFEKERPERLTHYLFRYPAKFHPPIAAALIKKYSEPGDLILDPFCGSATLFVEARVMGRNGIGLDIDPVATFIANAKTRRIGAKALRRSAEVLISKLKAIERSNGAYERLMFEDISDRAFRRAISQHRLRMPSIPNLFHWFRKYVIVDLARIRRAIATMRISTSQKLFFMACFCSIIRNVSNADPVPVSGLEVTSHMKAKEKEGRLINPVASYVAVVNRALQDRSQFEKRAGSFKTHIKISNGDATKLRKYIRKSIDVVITSPPYHNAVDYYRRHTLEMYWLDFVGTSKDRLRLLPKYIGRARVPQTHPFVAGTKLESWFARRCESMMRKRDPDTANAFKHYAISMQQCFDGLAGRLRRNGKLIFVLGKSSWNGRKLPTTKLFEELAAPHFRLREHYWYPLKNRYMTYSRHNGASIDREHVLVFERSHSTIGSKIY